MNSKEVLRTAVESSPPAAIAGAHVVLGLTLPDWVSFFTLVYLVLSSAHLVWRWRRSLKSHDA